MDAKVNTSEFAANAGFFNIEATLNWARADAGLLALSATLGLTGSDTQPEIKSATQTDDFIFTLSADESTITDLKFIKQ